MLTTILVFNADVDPIIEYADTYYEIIVTPLEVSGERTVIEFDCDDETVGKILRNWGYEA